MSKKVKTQDEFEAELKGDPQVFDGLAISIIARKGGGYNIIKIPVDSKNLEAGAVEVFETADSRSEAAEKFKIAVVRNNIL